MSSEQTPAGRDYPATAYELCERVCEAIEHAPYNYYQESYAQNPHDIRTEGGVKAAPEEVCGTAFCRAGWMCAIMDSSTVKRTPGMWDCLDLHSPAYECLQAAGLSAKEIGNLFGGDECLGTQYGTPAYIAKGIEGMRLFMKRHEVKLKAHRLGVGWKLPHEDDAPEEDGI